MPIILNERPPLNRIGVQLEGSTEYNEPYLVPGSTVVRQVFWSDIENERGIYNWPAKLDEDIRRLDNYPLVLNVKTSPAWARVYPDYPCSPPEREYWKDYAEFVIAVIDRYHPNAVEIWNEPETPKDNLPIGWKLYGCWGSSYNSGREYGRFVDYIYPIINQAHPRVLIVAGASLASNYLFRGGMQSINPRYDAYSIHIYRSDYSYTVSSLIKNVKKTITAPLWITETSLLCDNNCGDLFEQKQADYARYIFNLDSVEHVFWYTLYGNGWSNSDLAFAKRKKPAWFVYEDMLK